MKNTAVVFLAAGKSARFGAVKQLLPFRGKTLVRHLVDEAFEAGADPVVGVTGAPHQALAAELSPTRAAVVFNPDWPEGKGTGIAAGARYVLEHYPGVSFLVVCVSDQPFVSALLFEQMYQKHLETGQPMVACAYAGSAGTPVFFTRHAAEALLSLQADEGAKKILTAHPGQVATVDFPMGPADIDTPEDYERWISGGR
jgi:molybdenum cofactor cytidylyltransferase